MISEYTSNAAVLTHACRALIAMLGDLNGDSHARAHAIQANAVGAVTQALKAQPRFGPLHESATELLVALIEGDAERDACWALGGAQLAAVSIANHPSLPAVVQNACGLLERLCNTPQRAEAACALDAIAIVLTAVRMHRAEASVQIAGATCLKAMIVTANGKAKAAQAGAMEAAAVAVFGHADNVKMQEVGARLIKSLAVLESVRSRPTAAAAIEGLCASVSKHRENRLIAAEACGALCNLCIDQPLNRRKLAESGAAECVVAVMEEHMCVAGTAARGKTRHAPPSPFLSLLRAPQRPRRGCGKAPEPLSPESCALSARTCPQLPNGRPGGRLRRALGDWRRARVGGADPQRTRRHRECHASVPAAGVAADGGVRGVPSHRRAARG